MKLRTIAEVIVAEPDQILGLLGTAAKQVFAKGKRNLPRRYTRKTQGEVSYQNTTPKPGQVCQGCKYFDKQPGPTHKCKIVEGDIIEAGWCLLWLAYRHRR